MDRKAAEALEASIEHWKRLRDDPEGCRSRGEEPYGGSCPLCILYCDDDGGEMDCSGCPVLEDTGLHGCEGTPFFKAHDEWESHWIQFSLEPFSAAANKEIEYLESLREDVN